MDLQIIVLSGVNHKYHVRSLTYRTLKKDTNELIPETEAQRHRKHTYSYQRGKGGDQEVRINICTLRITRVTNEVLPHSTGNRQRPKRERIWSRTHSKPSFTRSSVTGQPRCIHASAAVDGASVNTGVRVSVHFWFFPDICPGAGLQDHVPETVISLRN